MRTMLDQQNTAALLPKTKDTEPAPVVALKIRNLAKRFGYFTALSGVNLDIKMGEFVCFLGPSGCGKTTLLRAIAGLDPQNEGTIHQNGRDISHLPVGQRDFGIVFQSYALFPNLSVERNVGYGLRDRGMTAQTRKARVEELLALVDLPDQSGKYPAQLSGGQQQRVALARALAPSPGLLLLDEPLSALDAQVRIHLRDQLKHLQRQLGVTTIMVTHDQEEAMALADRIVVMNKGVIEQVGTPTEVFTKPVSPFAAGFLGDMNFIPARLKLNESDTMSHSAQVDQPVQGAQPLILLNKATLMPVSGAQPFESDEAVSLCIRPADIRLTMPEHASPDGLMAQVETVSFRGNYYRLVLNCPQLGQSLDVELGQHFWDEMEITEGTTVFVHLPAAKIHVFRR